MLLLVTVSSRPSETHKGGLHDLPDGVEKTPAHVLMVEMNSIVAVFEMLVADQAFAVLGTTLGSILQPEHLAERAGNRSALQSNLFIVHAVDISHEHVDSAIVSTIRHGQHVVEGPSTGQQGHQTPKSAPSQVSTPDTLELPWPGHLNHRDTGSNVDQQVRVDIRSGLGKSHRFGVRITVGEHFVRDLGDEKIKA